MLFKDKLYLLKLLNLIEVFEENCFTKKVFVNEKYKRMIVFDRHILDFYYNLCTQYILICFYLALQSILMVFNIICSVVILL